MALSWEQKTTRDIQKETNVGYQKLLRWVRTEGMKMRSELGDDHKVARTKVAAAGIEKFRRK